MTQFEGPLGHLPASTRARLDELRRALERALGGELVSMLVHGSAVRGGFRENESDVDVVIVLKSAPLERLEAIGNALHIARNAARIECMLLAEEEVARAADVFPLLYGDIQRHHAVIAGGDPFASLEVSSAHLRLRIEQELREARIRLRRVAADGMGDGRLLAGALSRKIRQVRAPLRALLAMRGDACADELPAVLGAASAAWRVDTAPLTRAREAPREAYAAFVALLDAAIADVDAREDTAR
jgi:hypothetical protein